MMPMSKTRSGNLTNAERGVFFKEVDRILRQVRTLGQSENKKTGFCIGNTAKKVARDYFFTPIRNTALCVCGSIIIDKVAIAEALLQRIDGKVDYIFIDTEKKISPEMYSEHDAGNVERLARHLAVKSLILTYKGNDLTVDALDCFLAYKMGHDERGAGGKKIAIIGAGNIGVKLAIKLMERGANVFLVRRDSRKLAAIVQALNDIKPQGTIARVHGTKDIRKAAADADVIVGLTPGTEDITAAMLRKLKPGALLIDGGKGSFSRDAVKEAERQGISVWRSSIIASFEGQVAMLLKMHDLLEHPAGRKLWNGIPIVSAGLVGGHGEVIVNDIECPKEIFGIADGSGDFIRNLNAGQKKQLKQLSQGIKKKISIEERKIKYHASKG